MSYTPYVTNPEPPPVLIPSKIEGLPTTGLMGTSPAITVGSIIAVVAFIVNLVVQYFGLTIPPEVKEFADSYGIMLASIALPIITAIITRFNVFSPHSAAELQQGVRP